MRKISEKRKKTFVGKTYEILVTEKTPDTKGRNINYHQVVIRDCNAVLGEFVTAEIKDANHGSLFGELKRGV